MENQDIKNLKEQDKEKKQKFKNFFRVLKFALVACSAGAIQILVFALLFSVIFKQKMDNTQSSAYWPCYLIAIICSVIWSFTFNRKYTFKSVANIKIAMLKVLIYYLIFIPISTLWSNEWAKMWNVNPAGSSLRAYIILGVTMLINGITEYLVYIFWVYRGSIDSAQKKTECVTDNNEGGEIIEIENNINEND